MKKNASLDSYHRDILLCLVPITLSQKQILDKECVPFNVMMRVSFSTKVQIE
jgi:hypothetical protein